MTAPIVFLDTETTGTTSVDQIWELAAVRRDPDGTETELVARPASAPAPLYTPSLAVDSGPAREGAPNPLPRKES